MQDKYSLAKCEQYGRRLATRLSQQFFGPQPDATLDGPALLTFTPLRQMNLLVLRQLLGRWQHEASSLRSPYFNFEAEAVRAALTQFMNVLSRHIRLDRAALEPLLAQAAADTLLLAADPAAAFERLLLPAGDGEEAVTLASLRDGLRYLDASKPFFQGFIDSLPSGSAPLDREFLRQRLALYLTANGRQLPTVAQLVAELSALLPLTEADLWGDGPAKPVALTPGRTEEAPGQSMSIPGQSEDIPGQSASVPGRSASVPGQSASVPGQSGDALGQGVDVPSRSEVAPGRTASAPAPAGVPLYEKLKATQPTGAPLASALREAAHAEAGTSLAERGAPKVGSLREAISINQRFSFINELFNGENMEYHAAIQHLDGLPTAEAALHYVRQELATAHDWSRKEEHVGKLLKLIERKFGGA